MESLPLIMRNIFQLASQYDPFSHFLTMAKVVVKLICTKQKTGMTHLCQVTFLEVLNWIFLHAQERSTYFVTQWSRYMCMGCILMRTSRDGWEQSSFSLAWVMYSAHQDIAFQPATQTTLAVYLMILSLDRLNNSAYVDSESFFFECLLKLQKYDATLFHLATLLVISYGMTWQTRIAGLRSNFLLHPLCVSKRVELFRKCAVSNIWQTWV